MSKEQVTVDAIKKAKEILGFIKAEGTTAETIIEKAIKTPEEFESKKAEYQEALSKAKEFMEKAEATKKELEEANMGPINGAVAEGKGMDNVGTVTMKAEDVELIKADLSKSFETKIEAINTLYTAKEQENDILKKSLEDLTGKFTELTEKIDKIGKSSNGAKSLMKGNVIERFAPLVDGERTLSLKGNKNEIIAELVKAAGDDFNANNIFAKAASTVEIAGALANSPQEASKVAQLLRSKSGVIIVG
jgi:hypothetical protein